MEVRLSRTVNPATAGTETAPFRLAPPQPHPARGAARLALTLDAPQALRAEVFDARGRRVATLHDGPLAAGAHALVWDAAGAAPGLYLVRVTGAGGAHASRRVVLAR